MLFERCLNDGNRDSGTIVFKCDKCGDLFCEHCTPRIFHTLLSLKLKPMAECPACHQKGYACGKIK